MSELDQAMARQLLRAREEQERAAYRDEAQATEASKIVKVMHVTDGLVYWQDTSGAEGVAQNTRGSLWAPDTWLLISQAGHTGGWQVDGVAPYASG